MARVVAGVAAFAIALTGMVLGGTAAIAAPSGGQNTGVVVSDIQLLDEHGNPLTEQIAVGDPLTIKGTWDAKTADPQPGETFVIGLPREFDFVLGGPAILLKGWDQAGEKEEVWATCLPDSSTGDLTCTFEEIVKERTEIHGEFQFDVVAVGDTNEPSVEFDLNGTPGFVELPGGGGINDGIDLPGEVSKTGEMNGNNWSMTWTIDIPGASLVAAGSSTAHISDTLGAGHVLCSPFELTVHTVRGDDVQDVSELAAITEGGAGDSAFAFDLNVPEGGFDAGKTYQVKYQTCTPGNEIVDAGTTFTNKAVIEGWGEAGIGIGEATSRPWHLTTSKSGSVLGGAERNDTLDWAVTIPGDKLAVGSSFTFADKLGAGHQLLPDTVKNLRVFEQYGPSGSKRDDITGQLDRSNVMSDETSFALTLTRTDGANFKPSDWRYIVTYQTDVTGEDLPAGGTVYSNEATVNGVMTPGTATVPEREYAKTGDLNSKAKTLDGVEHSAFTTLDWKVTVPGEKFYDENGKPLTEVKLVDVLGDAHKVCEAGDPTQGIKERLGLKVSVKDQIDGGGKDVSATDLTPHTQAQVEGQQVTFTTTQSKGEAFDRELQYVFEYTTCTTSGGIDAKGTEYQNSITGSGVNRNGSVTMKYNGGGTGTGVAKGSVGIFKKITGPGAGLVPDGTSFQVRVEEFAPGADLNVDTPDEQYNLTVPLNSDEAVKGLFQRGTGWTMRLTEPTFPNVPGVTFGTPKFAASEGVSVNEDGTVATVTITPKTNIAVELTNDAQLGQMSVTKVLEGPAANEVDPNKEYGFYATIDTPAGVPNENPREFKLMAGGEHTLTNLPIGSVVTVSEVKPSNDDMFTWADPVVSPSPVTITADNVTTAAAVTVTNSVSRSVGTFSLKKSVEGAQKDNPAVPSEVTVEATWQEEGETEPSSKTLTLPTDGTPVAFGEQLLIGTQVTLAETPLVDGSSIAWGAPQWSGANVAAGDNNTAVLTISRNAAAQVTLTNHAATSTAGISLLKVVSGEAAEDVPADATFPVIATWVDEEGYDESRGLMINATEPTPLGVDLPAGTVVTITEGKRPAFDTVVWGSIAISGTGATDLGNGVAEIVVSDQQGDVTLVSVTNEATWAEGTFSLTKQIEGVLLDDAEVPEAVDVVASWFVTENGVLTEKSETISVPTDGSTVDFGQTLPAFTEVTLSEIMPDETDRFTWATPAWADSDHLVIHEDGTATLTIQPAGAHELSLTNTAVATLGSLELTKQLTGAGASAVSKDTEFAVTAEWIDLMGEKQSREIMVAAAKPVMIDDLPYGTEVTLTEATAKNPSGARWTAAKWASEDDRIELSSDGRTAVLTVIGENDATLALTLENDYAKVEALSVTGADFAGIGAAALVLAGLGGAALMLSRRKARTL